MEECDYLIILNNLQAELKVLCPPENVWRIVQETPIDFLKPWHVNPAYSAKTFTCDQDLSGPQYIRSHPMVPWHINRDYDFLSTCPIPEKSKTLSWIRSTRNVLPGHKKRMSLLHSIKGSLEELDLLGGNIRHILDQDAKKKIEREQQGLGFKTIEDKWAGLAPYKFSLAIESHNGPDYWTKKIADCFLSWTVPLYCGCSNLEEYFPPESFIRIDIEEHDGAIDAITRAIKEDSWQGRIPALEKARNLGIQEAHADYIAYIDDDARPKEDWMRRVLEIIADKQPDIFGGPAYPLFPEGKPDWFKEEYGVRGEMGKTGWLNDGFIIGTNIVFRKSLLQEYGGFDSALGMKADQLAYGEETLIVFRALKEGKNVYYSNEMAVEDHLPDYKKSLSFFIYNWYKVGKDLRTLQGETFDFSELPRLLNMIDAALNQFETALHKNKRNLQRYPYPENYIIENLKGNFVGIGKRMGYFLSQGNFIQEQLFEILLDSYQPGEIAGKLAIKQGLFKTTKEMMLAWFGHLKNKHSKSPVKDKPLHQYKVAQILDKLKENEDLILELGTGETKRGEGWITLDNSSSCDIVHDLRKPLPFPSNTFKTVYSSHVLEHLNHNQLVCLLKEVLRILKKETMNLSILILKNNEFADSFSTVS